MSVLQDATNELRMITADLHKGSEDGSPEAKQVVERLQRVVELLSDENAHWIGTTEAKRLLGIRSEHTVKAWARVGLLQGRTLPNGRLQVHLDDVLKRRAETEDLTALDGENLVPEELRLLREARPGKNPWEQSEREP